MIFVEKTILHRNRFCCSLCVRSSVRGSWCGWRNLRMRMSSIFWILCFGSIKLFEIKKTNSVLRRNDTGADIVYGLMSETFQKAHRPNAGARARARRVRWVQKVANWSATRVLWTFFSFFFDHFDVAAAKRGTSSLNANYIVLKMGMK